MIKQTQNPRRMRSAALAFAMAASLAVLVPSIGIAAETVQPKTTTATPVNGQTPTNRETTTNSQTTTNRQTPTNGQTSTTSQTPAYGQSPTSSQNSANRQTQMNNQSTTNGQSLSNRETATTGQKSTQGAMTMQGMSRTGNVDQDFAANLRMHHAMGVSMAQAQIDGGSDPEMKRVAKKFIDDQQAEIIVLDRWLASNKMPAPEAE